MRRRRGAGDRGPESSWEQGRPAATLSSSHFQRLVHSTPFFPACMHEQLAAHRTFLAGSRKHYRRWGRASGEREKVRIGWMRAITQQRRAKKWLCCVVFTLLFLERPGRQGPTTSHLNAFHKPKPLVLPLVYPLCFEIDLLRSIRRAVVLRAEAKRQVNVKSCARTTHLFPRQNFALCALFITQYYPTQKDSRSEEGRDRLNVLVLRAVVVVLSDLL